MAAQIQRHAVTWSEQGWGIQSAWPWAHAEAVTGNPEALRTILSVLSIPLWAQASTLAFILSKIQASHSSPVRPSSPLVTHGGSSSPT